MVRAIKCLPLEWAIAFNIRPPGCGSTFSSYPRRLNKVPFTPEDFHKILVYP